jgi:hypothetical protein
VARQVATPAGNVSRPPCGAQANGNPAFLARRRRALRFFKERKWISILTFSFKLTFSPALFLVASRCR